MQLFPNCKINIGLRVVRKREDGYHDLETLFYPVYGLHDELDVVPAAEFSFSQEGIVVDCPPEDNLIVRCYRSMAAHFPQVGPVAVRFRKNIPFGAGLGGGSSDAAHVALALNELFDLHLTKQQLAEEVKPLGADCPFFIYNVPCWAEGIGDILTPIDFSLKGYRLVMVKPDVAVSTRDAYAGLHPSPLHSSVPYHPLIEGVGGCPTLHSPFSNDFEATVFARYPLLADIKQRLVDAGAVYAAMSGSGSTIYGLFQHDAESGADTRLGTLDEDLAAMVIFDDTLG
ncbi:MAG: 4-(cytidine 5'-diphospho)-2-C-methyl-D-erythritol kinase [Paludibacteraceae bacterium]|nr:4-(cytidine 5'-diphospho)-2-C-methyl-D-erythritol kinase [Paludibacteraceae bacterium]